MEIAVREHTLEFSGTLSEDSRMDPVRDAILALSARRPGHRVRLDFSAVKRANSCGILAWFKLIEEIKVPTAYVRAPVWLVEQFNYSDFLRNDAIVESLLAPFYSPESDTHEIVVLTIGKDLPILKDYSGFEIHPVNTRGETLEADFEPEEYFNFLAANADRLAGATK